MKKDSYIQKELWRYGAKVCPLVVKDFNEDYFEYFHAILKEKDIKRIIAFARRELDQISKKKGLFKSTKKTSPIKGPVEKSEKKVEKPKKISEEEELINDIHGDFKKALHKSKEWSEGFEKLSVSYKEIYTSSAQLLCKVIAGYLKERTSKSIYEKNLKSLKGIFRLSDKECEIITFFYLLDYDDVVENLFKHNKNMNEMVKSVRLYCHLFQITPKRLKELMSKDSRMIRAGIITTGRRGSTIEISDLVKSYLAGYSRLDLMDNFINKSDISNALQIEEHNLSEDRIKNVINLIHSEKGSNILLYGKPGTGKTEFARSLGKALDKSVYFIKQADEDGDENLSHRKSGIVAALNMLDYEKSIVVVDECDEIVNIYDGFWGCEKEDGKDNKAWINDLLENSKHKIIWISNRVKGIDESTKRRFSYSIEFLNLGQSQRLKVWENQINAIGVDFLSHEEVQTFSRRYKVNAGGIALAMKDVSAMKHLKSKSDKIEALQSLLVQHQSFIFGDNKLNPISGTYSLEVLNCDINLNLVIDASRKFIDYSAQATFKEISNMNFLLQGPAGTGKTEFIKYMAQTLGKELLVKRMSDLQSMFVGETEKMISAAFKEAEESGSILFLDEADSLFVNRESAVRSYEVSQTNELLCQMENFKGILACATNFGQNMDVAVMRRFNYKIKFDFLTPDAKEVLFRKMLSDKLVEPLNSDDLEKIRKIPNLTPGDFKVVRQRNFFSESISAQVLVEQLDIESSYKRISRPMGLGQI